MYVINDVLNICTKKCDILEDICCNTGVHGFSYDSNPSIEEIKEKFPDMEVVSTLDYVIRNRDNGLYCVNECREELDWYIKMLKKEKHIMC